MVAAAQKQPKVLIIGIDGLRPDAMQAADTPTFDDLIANGALSNTAQTGDITVSGPGWSSFLTGVWRDKHGVTGNNFTGRQYEAYPCFFQRVKEVRPELTTASFVTWMPIDDYIIESSGADHRVAHDYHDDGDARAVEDAMKYLRTQDPDVVFFYFADVDVAGHDNGFHPESPGYIKEIEQVDDQMGRLIGAIRARPTYDQEDWLIISSTDHGGTLDGGHAGGKPVQRTIYYLVSGDAAARGALLDTANQVDIPVTAMAHMGIQVDPEWALDGKVTGLKKQAVLGDNLIYNGDAERSTGAQELTVNRGVAGWKDIGNMTVLRYGAPEGFPPAGELGGVNFFAGGAEGDSQMTQMIDVRELARSIDRNEVVAELSGRLGGYSDQRDMATVVARFMDDRGELGRLTIGPVTLEDRKREHGGEAQTGLLPRHARGSVPPGTRMIQIVLSAEVGSGANDGYADDLSLVLLQR